MKCQQTPLIEYGSNHLRENGNSPFTLKQVKMLFFFPLLSAAGYPKFLKLTIALACFQ